MDFGILDSCPVALVFLWLIEGINPLESYSVIGLLLWTLLWFTPALILHPIYYSINRKTELKYNKDSQVLRVIQDNNTYEVMEKDIKIIERIYYSDYRFPKWKQNYIPMPWRNYGILRILTNDDEEIFFTSLMIDILNPPIKPTSNKYKYIPFPPKTIKQKQIEFIEAKEKRNKRIEHFKMKYSGLTISDLNQKVNDNGLIEEAKVAAQKLINERNTTTKRLSTPFTGASGTADIFTQG